MSDNDLKAHVCTFVSVVFFFGLVLVILPYLEKARFMYDCGDPVEVCEGYWQEAIK